MGRNGVGRGYGGISSTYSLPLAGFHAFRFEPRPLPGRVLFMSELEYLHPFLQLYPCLAIHTGQWSGVFRSPTNVKDPVSISDPASPPILAWSGTENGTYPRNGGFKYRKEDNRDTAGIGQ